MRTQPRLLRSAAIAFLLSSVAASSAPRDVQITAVDFETSVITLENLGVDSEPLDGWRFCSHDEDQVRRYSSPTGLSGLTLEPGGVLLLHFLNDAPAGDPERINIAGRGNFATPLDRGAYGIQLYFAPVAFGDGNTIADHLQWSIDGLDNTSADDRSDEAQSGGVWTNQSSWIATAADTRRILLNSLDGGELHGPDDYTVLGPLPEPDPFEVETITSGAGGITLGWTVQKGVEYEIQRGDNLETYSPIGITTDGSFTDPEPPAGRAFYRVIGRFPR